MASSKKVARTIWLLCGLAFLAGCGASPALEEPGAAERGAISGGSTDSLNTNVFGLLIHAEDGVAACSSTLIAENLLLTARHCIASGGADPVICGQAEFGDPYLPTGVFASNAIDVTRTQDWYHGSEIFVPAEGNDTCGFDVALVVLKELVPATVAKPAVPRIDRDVEKGELYGAVGYGLTATADYGIRRSLGSREVQCDPGTCRSGVRGNEFVGTSGPCEGDSGGPAFDAEGKVVGVDSRGGQDCSMPVYSALTGWRDFLSVTAQHAAEVGGYEPPFWATTGKSDPPVVVPPPAPSTPTVAIGATCDASSLCANDGVCYQVNDGSEPHCVARCSGASDCRADERCVPVSESVNACITPKATKHSGCQFAPSPSGGFGWALLALGLLFARRRAHGQQHRVR